MSRLASEGSDGRGAGWVALVVVALLAGCQSKTERWLEQANARFPGELESGALWMAASTFLETDRRLRIEKGSVNGVPAKQARAAFRASAARQVLSSFHRVGCPSSSDETEMLEQLSGLDDELRARWADKRTACDEAQHARAANASKATLEALKDVMLVLPKGSIDRVMEGCAAGVVGRVTKRRPRLSSTDELQRWNRDTNGEASRVIAGTASLEVDDLRLTREHRTILTDRLVESEKVTVALAVRLTIEERAQPVRTVVAAWFTKEAGREDLDPLKISTDADLWPYLCKKLENAEVIVE